MALQIVETVSPKRFMCRCTQCGCVDRYCKSYLDKDKQCKTCKYRLTDEQKQFLESLYPRINIKDKRLSDAHLAMIKAVKYIAPDLSVNRFLYVWHLLYKRELINTYRENESFRSIDSIDPPTYIPHSNFEFLESFPAEDREIIYQRFVEDRDSREVAKLAGISESKYYGTWLNRIKRHVSRCRDSYQCKT